MVYVYLIIFLLIIIMALIAIVLANARNSCNCKQKINKERETAVSQARLQLLEGLKENRFEVYYQPKIGLNSQSGLHAEALIRYKDEDGKIVPPSVFVPQLESMKLIHHIDLFVFEKVIQKLEEWKNENIMISLNFSRNTLLYDDVLVRMSEIMSNYHVNKNKIEIEITESVGSEDEEKVAGIAMNIHDMGYKLSLDDFGSQYSNVSILAKLPFDTLKLDKSIVDHMIDNSRNSIIVEEFLRTCKKLGIDSVAEGIETEEQEEILSRLGCDLGQGYLFDKPLSEDNFEKKYVYAKKE